MERGTTNLHLLALSQEERHRGTLGQLPTESIWGSSSSDSEWTSGVLPIPFHRTNQVRDRVQSAASLQLPGPSGAASATENLLFPTCYPWRPAPAWELSEAGG